MDKNICLAIGILGLAISYQATGHAQVKAKPVTVEEIGVFRTDVLPNQFYASQVLAFDLAPAGQSLAVLLWTHPRFDDSGSSVWLVFWDIATKRIERSARLEGPEADVRGHAQYHFQVRLAPTTGKLFVLTGPRVVALDLETLRVDYAIESPAIPGRVMESRLIKHFSLAEDGSRLAVELWRYSPSSFGVVIIDAKSGGTLSTWKLAGPGWVALSPDGSRIAFGRDSFGPKGFLRDRANVFVCDAMTGKAQREIKTGHPTVEAQFSETNQVIIHSDDRVRIWRLDDPQDVKEFEYGKYGVHGVIGSMGFSQTGSLVAVVVIWSSEWNRRLDTDIFPGWIRLVLWDLSSGKRIYVSPNSKTGPGTTTWEVIRVSVDGSRLAIGGDRSGHHVWVLSVQRK